MAGGFNAIPDELRDTAGKIGEVVGGVADMVWQGPSGDYGHPGVQSGWADFIEQMKSQVLTLRDKANEHGDGLGEAARKYFENDADTGDRLGKLGGLLGESLGGPVGGGFTGGITDVLDGKATAGGEVGGAGGGALGGAAGGALGGGAGEAAGGAGEAAGGALGGSAGGAGGFMNPEVAGRLDPQGSAPDPGFQDLGPTISEGTQEGPLY